MAGVAAAMAPAGTEAAGASGQDVTAEREIARTLREIRDELVAMRRDMASSRMPTSPSIAVIRRNQRQFLKSNQKFPDYMEIGAGVWDDLVDWHVRTLRQVNITQRADGRYTMPFLQTHVILRVDYDDETVGLGFDQRGA
jgi:hypothetical protein